MRVERGTGAASPWPSSSPPPPTFDHDKPRRTAEALRQASKGTTLAGLSLKELVNQGRK
jgi:hypothetical protein